MNIIDRIESGELTMVVNEHPLGRCYRLDWATVELLRLAKLGQAAEIAMELHDEKSMTPCWPEEQNRRVGTSMICSYCGWQDYCKLRNSSGKGCLTCRNFDNVFKCRIYGYMLSESFCETCEHWEERADNV